MMRSVFEKRPKRLQVLGSLKVAFSDDRGKNLTIYRGDKIREKTAGLHVVFLGLGFAAFMAMVARLAQ